MRWMARRARSTSRRARVFTILTILATAVAFCAALIVPSNVGAAGFIHATSSPTPSQPLTVSSTSQAFDGVPVVGALFTSSGGKLGTHFCTASVVHSAHGDLAVTAAHCVAGVQGQVVFVPGYANGKEPYGVWPVSAIYTDKAWQSDQDADDDVAFLRLSDAGGGVPIEDVTGAVRLGTSPAEPALVRVIGYPGDTDQPVSCANWTKAYSATQLEFDCDGYTDGTSGGPFLANASGTAGQWTVVGVIGGYELGGDSPDVSYAAHFGAAVAALYWTAEAGG
jgi:V8-like Glu-specific endopeptidase